MKAERSSSVVVVRTRARVSFSARQWSTISYGTQSPTSFLSWARRRRVFLKRRLSFFRGARGERGGLRLALRLRPRGRHGGSHLRSHFLVVAGLLLRGAILFLLFGGRLRGDLLVVAGLLLFLFGLFLARAQLLRRLRRLRALLLRRLLVADALSLCFLRQPRAPLLRLLLLPRALLRRLLLLLGLRLFKRRRGGSAKVFFYLVRR